MSTQQAIQAVAERFPEIPFAPQPLLTRKETSSDQLYITVPPARLAEVMSFLRDDERTRFEQLIDVTCVDYLNFSKARDRYGVVYLLLSLTHEHRLWIKCFLNDPD